MPHDLSGDEVGTLLRIVERLSRSLDSDALRVAVAEDLLRLMRAEHMASFIWDDRTHTFGRAVYLNMSAENLARYDSHFQHHDPITSKLQRRRRATLVTEVMAQPELERTAFFNDFLMRDGLHHGINLYAYDGARNIGDLRIWRGRRQPAFAARDKALLDAVRPHFRNALRNARAFETVRRAETASPPRWGDLWDRWPGPSYLFDCGGALAHRNDAAAQLAQSMSDQAHASFMDRVAALAGGDLTSTRWGPYFLSMLRFDGDDVASGADGNQGRVGVLAYRGDAMRVDPQWLVANRGVTPREAEICVLVLKGLTDAEIGSTLGISPETVRSHVKNLFAKLDASNRTELVHAVLDGLVDVTL